MPASQTERLIRLRAYGRDRAAARAYGRTYMAARYLELLELDLCPACGSADLAPGRRKCRPCLDRNNGRG